MTQPSEREFEPGLGDPAKSDDTDVPGLRSGLSGSAPPDALTGPAPAETAGGGYGTESGTGTSGGSPDGEDVQVSSGPGPQTDWLRGAQGLDESETDDLGR